MAAVAIPFATLPSTHAERDEAFAAGPFGSASSLSRSPFMAQLARSPARSYTKPNAFQSFDHSVELTSPKGMFSGALPQPAHKVEARPVRPSVVVPQSTPLPSVIHSGSMIDNFHAALRAIDMDECDAHGENAFFVCDLAEVHRQILRWNRELGERVQAFFAVKSNPDPFVLKLMAAHGLGFDCASQPEISSALQLDGVDGKSRIIYANPCKAPSFIRHAAANGVDLMTFDNADELKKVKKFHPNARMVLRILTDDSGSLCRLGLKFGAPLGEVRGLLRKAKELGVAVSGISFHCGSGCKDPALFGDAIRRARWAFDVAAEEGFALDLLDIGGGFEDANFELIAAILRDAIAEHFPRDGGVRIIAEPGRYFVSEAFELATNIIARRAAREGTNSDEDLANDFEMDAEDEDGAQPAVMYYINDGVYGSFNGGMFDHQIFHPQVLSIADKDDADAPEPVLEECSVWGPTCDSIDLIQAKAVLPTNRVQVGDWLRWERMGAYSVCAASQFNGFRQSQVRYTVDAKGDAAMEQTIRALMKC